MKFSQLSKGVQAEVIDRHRLMNVDFPEWEDNLMEETTKELSKVLDLEKHSGIFWGSGYKGGLEVSVDIKRNTIGWQEVIRALDKNNPKHALILRFLESVWLRIDDSLKVWEHYITGDLRDNVGEFTNKEDFGREWSLEIDELGIEEDVEELIDALNPILDEVIKEILWKANAELEKFHKKLKEEHESLTSDKSVIETLKVNEYEFSEKGELINLI